jgi:HK97 family phage prohead protease
MKTKEITRPFEIKAIGDDGTIEGYCSVFGNIDSYRDIVMPGAFKESLAVHAAKGTMPAMLWQHRSDQPLGVWQEMSEDAHGLRGKGQLCLDTTRGREARALLKMKAIRGLSIGFSVPEGGEEFDQNANVNKLHKITLWEVSPVTFPANEAANVDQVRSQWLTDHAIPAGMLEEVLSSRKRLEKFLRDVGLPRAIAKQLVGRHSENRREVDADDSTKDLLQLVQKISA